MKYFLKKIIVILKNKIQEYPKLKTLITYILKYFPKIQSKIKRIDLSTNIDSKNALKYSQLNPKSKEIYDKLKFFSEQN